MAGQQTPNKRSNFAIETCAFLGLPLDVYGSDSFIPTSEPAYQKILTYKGLVDDEELNRAYNTHSIVFNCTHIGGLELTPIEAICSLTPVIALSDGYTSKEFIPEEFISAPNSFDMMKKVEWILGNKEKVDYILREFSDKYSEQFSKINVARRIIESYEKI